MAEMEKKDTPIETLNDLNDLWEQATTFQTLQEQRWAMNERLTNSKHLTARKPGRSSIFVPKIQGYVRRKQADHVDSFTGESPIGIKNTLTSSVVGAKILQKVVNHYLDTKINWVGAIYDASYDALVYEFAPTFVWWEEEYDTVKTTDMEGKTVEIQTLVDSYPIVEVIPPENARIDPSVSWDNTDEATYLSFLTYRDKAYAEQKEMTGDWPNIPDEEFYNSEPQANTFVENERKTYSSPFHNMLQFEDDGRIEVRVHFYWEEIDGNLVPCMAETLYDRMLLSGPTPLPYYCAEDRKHAWPMVIGHVYPKPHEQYAAALPEQSEGLQLEVNAIRNQRRDNVALILNPERIVTPESGIDPANVSFSFPGKVIVSQSLEGMSWNRPPDVTASGYQEEQTANSDMDRLLSEGPQRVGAPAQRKETATASQLMAAGSSASVNLDLTLFATSWVEQVVRRIAELAKQAAPSDIFEKAAISLGLDPNMIDAVHEATTGNFLFNVYAGGTQADLNNEISNATNIAAMVQQMYGPNANYQPILAKVLNAAGYDPDKIIPNPQDKMQGSPLPDMSQVDMGGVQPGAEPNMQFRQATVGGAFGVPGGAQ